MGLHPLDLLIILLFGLALFGPRMLQSVARNLGRGVGQARGMKDRLKAELQVDELSQISESLPHVPRSTREAAHMLIKSEPPAQEKEQPAPKRPPSTPAADEAS
jgi:Sec-independent protein translocase protein TatA